MSNSKSLKQIIIDTGENWIKNNKGKEPFFTNNLKAEKLIWSKPLVFVLAVIYSQGIKAERAWEVPYLLKARLGYLDTKRISETKEDYLISLFNKPPKLHRFPTTMAKRTIEACKLIIKKYNNNPENIRNDNPKSDELQRRFQEFNGVGQKKASMATNILVRDFGIKVKDKSGIDISYDIHVRRIFLRTGLVEKDDVQTIINKARELKPEYPWYLRPWVLDYRKRLLPSL